MTQLPVIFFSVVFIGRKQIKHVKVTDPLTITIRKAFIDLDKNYEDNGDCFFMFKQ